MLRLSSLLAALLLALPTSAKSLNVVIRNQYTGYADSAVYFAFRDAAVTGTINGQPLVRDQCYSLVENGSGISLNQLIGSRIYFSLGAPLSGTGDPEPINSTGGTVFGNSTNLPLVLSSRPATSLHCTAAASLTKPASGHPDPLVSDVGQVGTAKWAGEIGSG